MLTKIYLMRKFMLPNNIFNNLSGNMLKKISSLSLMYVTALAFSGCAVTPTSVVQQPTTAKAVDTKTATNNGAIFNAAGYRPMFEDRRPRFVGDIITINITENTAAKKVNASSASKEGEANFNTDAQLSKNLKNIPLAGSLIGKVPYGNLASFSASSSNSYDDKADANASNTFSGSIVATVIEVLPNGNLVVSGEKQVALDKGTEFVRFSGVVNPETISLGNSIPSTKVADARIEYRTNSKIDGAAIASVFARFFLSMAPW
jgi:flagellar L-ring protein precursor FlgH